MKQGNDECIISIGEIQQILQDYRIGKKPLAKLLGWGETTIIRYIEGDIPTIEYSDKLKAILMDPSFYYNILLKNKENLTGVAFKKSKNAVLDKLMASRINVIAQHIVNINNADLSPSFVQSMLYYSQVFSLALYDEELFDTEYRLTYNDMPYLNIYDNMKKFGVFSLEIGENALSPTEKGLIQAVNDCFSWYGIKTLFAMMTNERTALRISRDKENNKIIEKETLKAYFKNILLEYKIDDITSISNYPDQKIVQIKKL